LPIEKGFEFSEYPWVANGTARNPNPVNAGGLIHTQGVDSAKYIAGT
jgi:hypothetical protein